MGSLCSACRKAQDETEEDQPLLHSNDDVGPGVELQPETSEELIAKYYQRIIDDANRQFITSLRYRNRVTSNADDMRYKLQSAAVDEALILSPPSANLFKAMPGNNKTSLSSMNVHSGNKGTLEVLSEPVIVNDGIDLGMDEIAEIVNSWISANAISTRGEGEEGCVAYLHK